MQRKTMPLEWICSPVTQYATIALALGGCLALFFSTKIEMRRARNRAGKSVEELAAAVQALTARIEEMQNRLESVEASPSRRVVREGLNFTKRTQAMRMHSRGEGLSTIAAALEVPLGEIELLVKLQQLQASKNPGTDAVPGWPRERPRPQRCEVS